MWNKLLLLCLATLPLGLLGQQNISGTVTDATTGQPVDGAHIVVKGTSVHTFCMPDGTFALEVPRGQNTLIVARLGYEVMELQAESALRVKLKPEVLGLGTAEVRANKRREEIDTGSPTMAVLDFAFYDRYLVVLGRDYVGNRTVLRLLGDDDAILAEHTLTEAASDLVTDCSGTIHLLTETQAYQLYYDYQELHLLYPVGLRAFYTIAGPCLAQAFDHVFVRRESYMGLRAEIWAAGPDSTFCLNRHEDSDAVTYLHREYDLNYYLAIRRRGEGYMYPVDVLIANLEYFHENQSYDVLDRHIIAPSRIDVARVGNHLTLWNWGTDSVAVFTDDLKPAGSAPLPVTDGRLLPDHNGTELYCAVESKGGITTLYRVDPELEVVGKWKLGESAHATTIRVRSGVAYFLDKAPSDQRGFRLYRKILN